MFERFSAEVRLAMVRAQDEARRLKHTAVGSEHLLLGLLTVTEGLAVPLLRSLGVTLEEVRSEIVRIVGEGEEDVHGRIPLTPRAKKVLELGLREALAFGQKEIRGEHLLLGLADETEGLAARIPLDFHADTDTIRQRLLQMLRDPDGVSEVMAGWPFGSTEVTEPVRALAVGALLDSVKFASIKAVSDKDFDQAAMLRGIERRLIALLKKIPNR